MTLGTTPPVIDYIENGATLIHAIPFQFRSSSEILCSRITAAGVETTLALGTDFAVAGGGGSTGAVTKTNGGTPGTTFRIKRLTTRGQPTNFAPHDTFPADVVESSMDRLAAVNEEQDVAVAAALGQALRVPLQETVPPLPSALQRANTFFGFGNTGEVVLRTATAMAAALQAAVVAALGSGYKGDPGSPGEGYATRPALATAGNTAANLDDAYLTEVGRKGKFIFHTAAGYLAATGLSLAGCVAADPLQGLYVARASDPTGANGAWVREFEGEASVWWWGAKADDDVDTPGLATDNADQFHASLTALQARATALLTDADPARKYWWLIEPLRVPAGRYYLRRRWSIVNGGRLRIEMTGAELRFPAASFGIVVNSYDTDVEGPRDGPFPQDTVLVGPAVRGVNGGDRTKHGIWLRTRAVLINPDVRFFPGDGIRVGISNGHFEGNQNGWQIINPFVQVCNGDGIHVEGGDSNAGACYGGIIDICGRFGIHDKSFLGNSWFSPQVSNTGGAQSGLAGTTPAFVNAGGHNWAVVLGQEAAAMVTAPSLAASAVWIDMGVAPGPDPSIPGWFNGIIVEAGGAICAMGATCASSFYAPYAEGGYAVYQLGQYAIVHEPRGGVNAQRGGIFKVPLIHDRVSPGIEANYTAPATGTTTFSLLGGNVAGQFARWIAPSGHQWRWVEDTGFLFLKDDSLGVAPFAINGATGRHNALDVEGAYRFNGIKVVGAQQPAIANDASGAANQAKLNAILDVLRLHGLIAL